MEKTMLNTTQIKHIQIIPLIFVTVRSPPPQLNDPVSFRLNKTFKVHFKKMIIFSPIFFFLLFLFPLPYSCHWYKRKIGGRGRGGSPVQILSHSTNSSALIRGSEGQQWWPRAALHTWHTHSLGNRKLLSQEAQPIKDLTILNVKC